MVMLWCLHVLRILCDIMNTQLSNMQIPIPVLENKEVGQIEELAAFHAASKGCIKQDVGCCKGQRSQTVCHPCQAPRNLRVDTLSTLSWQTAYDAAQRRALSKMYEQAREKKKSASQLFYSTFEFPSGMTPKWSLCFLTKVAKSNWEAAGEKLHPEKKLAFCFGWLLEHILPPNNTMRCVLQKALSSRR